MREALKKGRGIARDFIRIWTQPHRLAAFLVLTKAAALLGALCEIGWLLNTHFFALRFPQLPLSLAWSMLTVIFCVTYLQVVSSVAFKFWGTRRARQRAVISSRMSGLLADYLSGKEVRGEITDAAQWSPDIFERSMGAALLRLRGSSRLRLCELPEVAALRLRWMERAAKGNDEQRRRAVEQLGLLRDPKAIPALEKALEDSVAVVAAAAIRGLLLLPSYGKREELLRSLPNRSYLVRVLTACESADDALRLAMGPSADDRMLELARLHGRVMGEGDLLPLLDDRDAKKRNSALRLIPLAAPGAAPSRGVVLAALRHHQLKMRSAAVEVAAKLRLSRAIPAIAEYAKQADSSTDARASCAALAELGAAGRDLLRQMSAAGEAGDAPAEALGAMMAASARGSGL